jgi:hypothetical protein
MRNINMRINRGFDYSDRKKHIGGSTSETEDRRRTIYAQKPSYATFANIKGLTVNGLRVFIPNNIFESFKKSALSLYQVEQSVLSDVSRTPAGTGSGMPVITMENCRSALLTKCFALPDTDIFLGLEGGNTKNISLVGNDLVGAKTSVKLSAEVSKNQVRIR